VGAMTAAASSGKLLVVGAFLGSVLTASVGYGVVRVALGARHESPKTAEVTSPRASESQAKTWVPVGETPTDPASAPASPPQAAIATESASPAKAAASTLQAPRKIVVGSEDALDRAGALLLEARGALRRGDPEGALAMANQAARVSSKLEPEEMAIRSLALRKLGKDSEAEAVDVALRTKYPGHSLAR
jgi:hypothetical protein